MNEVQKLLAELGLEATPENISKVEAMVNTKTTGVDNKNKELLDKMAKYKGYENLDLEKLQAQANDNEVNEYLEHIKKGSGAEYLEAIREAAKQEGLKAAEAEYTAHKNGMTSEIEEYKTKFTELQNANDNSLITEYLRDNLSNINGINKDFVDPISAFARDMVEVAEVEGKRTVQYKNAGLNEKGVQRDLANDWFVTESQKAQNAWWSQQKPGSGGAGGQNPGQTGELEDMNGDDILGELGL